MQATGRLSRRKFISTGVVLATTWELQKAAFALGLPATSPVCQLTAEQEVGPFYVKNELLRTDIREGKPGLPLQLRLVVLDARTCRPLPRAAVDVWHCDAMGLYAGYTKMDPRGPGPMPGRPGGPPPPPGFRPDHPDPNHPGNRPGPPEGMGPPPPTRTTDELTFLRGVQFTGAGGEITFQTVFPGFYMGRTNHIHFKVREGGHVGVRPGDSGHAQTYLQGHTAHIGQVFFPEEFTAELMRHQPYASHRIERTTPAEDGIYQGQHGAESMATLRPLNRERPELGYAAELVVAVDPGRTPAPVGFGGPPPERSSG